MSPQSFIQDSPATMIDSLLHPLAREIRSVLEASLQAASSRILIDDEENIVQALRAGITIEQVFFAGDIQLSKTFRESLPIEIAIHEVARRTCKKLFEKDKVSRIFALAQTSQARTLADLARLEGDIIVLDKLHITGNIGAIVRTSFALGAGAVVLIEDNLNIYDRRLIRASRGHVFSLPVVKASSTELLDFCSQHGRKLLVTNPYAAQTLDAIAALSQNLAIVFGDEKKGCSQELINAASFHVRIPMQTTLAESLNVSVAAGIVLYHRHENRPKAGFNRSKSPQVL